MDWLSDPTDAIGLVTSSNTEFGVLDSWSQDLLPNVAGGGSCGFLSTLPPNATNVDAAVATTDDTIETRTNNEINQIRTMPIIPDAIHPNAHAMYGMPMATFHTSPPTPNTANLTTAQVAPIDELQTPMQSTNPLLTPRTYAPVYTAPVPRPSLDEYVPPPPPPSTRVDASARAVQRMKEVAHMQHLSDSSSIDGTHPHNEAAVRPNAPHAKRPRITDKDRRDTIRGGLDQLRSLVLPESNLKPIKPTKPPSQATIISAAVGVIRDLQARLTDALSDASSEDRLTSVRTVDSVDHSYPHDLHVLQQENDRLKKMLSDMQQMVAASSSPSSSSDGVDGVAPTSSSSLDQLLLDLSSHGVFALGDEVCSAIEQSLISSLLQVRLPSSQVLIWRVNSMGRIVEVNEEFSRLTGFHPTVVIGKIQCELPLRLGLAPIPKDYHRTVGSHMTCPMREFGMGIMTTSLATNSKKRRRELDAIQFENTNNQSFDANETHFSHTTPTTTTRRFDNGLTLVEINEFGTNGDDGIIHPQTPFTATNSGVDAYNTPMFPPTREYATVSATSFLTGGQYTPLDFDPDTPRSTGYALHSLGAVPPLPENSLSRFFPHNCLAGDTAITLADGFSRPIIAVPVDTLVLSHDEVATTDTAKPDVGFVTKRTSALLDQGVKECVELLFSDGRTITCTHDHRFLTADGQWITAEDMTAGTTDITAGMEYPHLAPLADADDKWELDLTDSLGLKLNAHNRLGRSLAFAGLIGYLITAGSISEDGSVLCPGHPLDIQAIQRDIHLLTGIAPTASRDGTAWTIHFPAQLHQAMVGVGASSADRIETLFHFPAFLMSPTCPVPVVQAFIGGLFGGDGKAPSLTWTHKLVSAIAEIRFSLTFKGSVQADQTRVAAEELQCLMMRCGIPKEALGESLSSNAESGVDPKESDSIVWSISTSATLPFARSVGFRYCWHKQMRLTAACAYYRLKEALSRQKKFISDAILAEEAALGGRHLVGGKDENSELMTCINEAKAQLAKQENVHPDIQAWKPTELKDAKQLGMDIHAALQSFDALKFFSTPVTDAVVHGVESEVVLPSFRVRLVGKREAGLKATFDLTVPETENFIANGLTSHNCPNLFNGAEIDDELDSVARLHAIHMLKVLQEQRQRRRRAATRATFPTTNINPTLPNPDDGSLTPSVFAPNLLCLLSRLNTAIGDTLECIVGVTLVSSEATRGPRRKHACSMAVGTGPKPPCLQAKLDAAAASGSPITSIDLPAGINEDDSILVFAPVSCRRWIPRAQAATLQPLMYQSPPINQTQPTDSRPF